MSNVVKTGDYKSFDVAVSTIGKLTHTIMDENDNIRANVNKISSDTVFAGPILDSTKDGLGKLNKILEETNTNFNTMSNNITQTVSNYKKGDKAASDVIEDGIAT